MALLLSVAQPQTPVVPALIKSGLRFETKIQVSGTTLLTARLEQLHRAVLMLV